MVAKDILLAKIVVDGKSETGGWTVYFLASVGCKKQNVSGFFPAQFIKMQVLVI